MTQSDVPYQVPPSARQSVTALLLLIGVYGCLFVFFAFLIFGSLQNGPSVAQIEEENLHTYTALATYTMLPSQTPRPPETIQPSSTYWPPNTPTLTSTLTSTLTPTLTPTLTWTPTPPPDDQPPQVMHAYPDADTPYMPDVDQQIRLYFTEPVALTSGVIPVVCDSQSFDLAYASMPLATYLIFDLPQGVTLNAGDDCMMRLSANAVRDYDGYLLDGDGNGNSGDDFTTTFTVRGDDYRTVFTVNQGAATDDGACTPEHCTLVEAVNAANGQSQPVRIEVTMFLSLDEYTQSFHMQGAYALPQIRGDVMMVGVDIERDETAPNFGLIDFDGDRLILSQVYLRGGQQYGGLNARGEVWLLDNSHIATNQTNSNGGGLRVQGDLTINDSRISGNEALGLGGGLYNWFGAAILHNTQMHSNKAGMTGESLRFFRSNAGVYDSPNGPSSIEVPTAPLIATYLGHLVIQNVELSDNAHFAGGIDAVVDRQTVSVINTFILNAPDVATNGISMTAFNSGKLYIVHSVLQENAPYAVQASSNVDVWVNGSILTGSAVSNCNFSVSPDSTYNISDDDSCRLILPHLSNQHNTDPQLVRYSTPAALAPNVGSPVIDAIPAADCVLTFDYLGLLRPVGEGCDIGSVELQAYYFNDITPDVDDDGWVTPRDVMLVLNRLGQSPPSDGRVDLDSDGSVTGDDVRIVLDALGQRV